MNDPYEVIFCEIYDKAFNEKEGKWENIWIESSFKTEVIVPSNKEFLGYDIISFSARTNPECSLLSCNGLYSEVDVNEHCLCEWDLDRVIEFVSGIKPNDVEPGPYKIYGLYRIP